MYTAKEAVIAKEHMDQVNPTIFSMDIRAYGKDFDKYIDRAQEEYGVRYIRSRISHVEEDPKTKDLILTYEAEDYNFSGHYFSRSNIQTFKIAERYGQNRPRFR